MRHGAGCSPQKCHSVDGELRGIRRDLLRSCLRGARVPGQLRWSESHSGPPSSCVAELTFPNRSLSPEAVSSQYGRATRKSADATISPRRNHGQREDFREESLTVLRCSRSLRVILGFDQEHGDIVLTSRFVRGFDQCECRLFGVAGMMLDQLPNFSSCYLISESIGTKQERRLPWKNERMDFDEVGIVGRVSRTSQVSVDFIPARVVHGCIFAEPLGVFQLTYRRVVACDLLDLSWSEEIQPGVAHVPHRDMVLLDQCDCGDARHAGPLWMARCGFEDFCAGQCEGLPDALVARAGAAG